MSLWCFELLWVSLEKIPMILNLNKTAIKNEKNENSNGYFNVLFFTSKSNII